MLLLRFVVSVLIAATVVSASPLSAATVNRMTLSAYLDSSATSSTWPEFVIHAFSFANSGGVAPLSGLFREKSGALYGTTSGGGSRGGGTVFKLTPPAPGETAWTEQTLHEFVVSSKDGYSPGAGVIADAGGALYGTTTASGSGCYNHYCGTVFKLTPPAAGKTSWTNTVLHTFTGTQGDGNYPGAALVLDAHGALYGTTELGGGFNGGCNGRCGIVFKLAPPVRGKTAWTETVLHSFTAADGANPEGGLILEGDALYGTTLGGGPRGYGTVFKLSPPTAGKSDWTETIVHAFGSGPHDGANPVAGVIDIDGALYGTTSYGGSICSAGCGSVFKLTPPKAGKSNWTFDALHFFGTAADGYGYRPSAALIADRSGALYSTTLYGGAKNYGTVFKLTPPASGKGDWKPSLLHYFTAANGDGGDPTGSLAGDPSGNVYGTASVGGLVRVGDGIVFELHK